MVVLLDVPTDRVCLDSDAMEDFVKTTAAVDAFKFAMDVFCCAAFCFVAQTQNKVKKKQCVTKMDMPDFTRTVPNNARFGRPFVHNNPSQTLLQTLGFITYMTAFPWSFRK
jgi:hypothetical protein